MGKNPYQIFYKGHVIQMAKAYEDIKEGLLLALFASNGYLQLAVYRGKAASLEGISVDKEVMLVMSAE